MKKTRYIPGQFCWVDLQTPEPDRAKEFYAGLFGWDFKSVPTDLGPAYTMLLKNGLATAGMAPQTPEAQEANAPPVWSSYICVDSAEATLAKAQELNAELVMPVTKMGNHGSLAFLKDPMGAAFGLWQPEQHVGAGWVNDEGGFCWNELYTKDTGQSISFYEKLFGWEFQRSRPNGREYWTIKNFGHPNAGMMSIRPEWGEVPPSWAVYFAVESCKDSVAKAQALGAKLFLSPTEVPEAGLFAGLQDPQGAHFLIIELSKKG